MQQPTEEVVRELHRMIEKHQEFQSHVEELKKDFCDEHADILGVMMESYIFLSSSIALLAGLVLNEVRGPGIVKEKKEHEHTWVDGIKVAFGSTGPVSAKKEKVCLKCGKHDTI